MRDAGLVTRGTLLLLGDCQFVGKGAVEEEFAEDGFVRVVMVMTAS